MLGAALLLFAFHLFPVQTTAADAAEAGGTAARYLALTFDDGPSGKATEYLLAGLRERGVRATFFLCGYRMEQFPSLVWQIADEGHELAIHGYSHAHMNTMAQSDVADELAETSGLITELSGVGARLFRPPGGLYSDAVLAAAEENGLSIVLWNNDPHDWSTPDAATVARRVASSASSGDVVLLHDMYRTSADAAFRIIDTLAAQGWQFVTVSELAALKGQTLTPGEILTLAP